MNKDAQYRLRGVVSIALTPGTYPETPELVV